MTAIEEIIKWLSSDDNETELNFESTVTNDNPEFYNTNTEPIEVNCRREVPDYNTDKWEFVYVYSQDTKERLLKEPKSGHSKFRRAMERLLQTASPEEDSRRRVVKGPSKIDSILTNDPFVQQNQPSSSIKIGFVFHDAFPSLDKLSSKSSEERVIYDSIKDDMMKNCDIIISMSSFIKPESEYDSQPNFVFAISEINQPKFQQMKDKIESYFLNSLRLEKFGSRETFSLDIIQDNVMEICADVFSNIESRVFEARAVASNFVIQKNQHFAKQIELLDKVSKKQAKNRQKMDMFDKFPKDEKRVHGDGNLSLETQVDRKSYLLLRKVIAHSLTYEDLGALFETVYGKMEDIPRDVHVRRLSQNPLQAYYAIPPEERHRLRVHGTDFSYFKFYKTLKKLTKEYQLDISCECDSCVPHQLWELLHFFDSMEDDLESIQEFGLYGDKLAGATTESNTIQNWNYLNWSFNNDSLHKRCRENIQDEIKMKYSEQYRYYLNRGR